MPLKRRELQFTKEIRSERSEGGSKQVGKCSEGRRKIDRLGGGSFTDSIRVSGNQDAMVGSIETVGSPNKDVSSHSWSLCMYGRPHCSRNLNRRPHGPAKPSGGALCLGLLKSI